MASQNFSEIQDFLIICPSVNVSILQLSSVPEFQSHGWQWRQPVFQACATIVVRSYFQSSPIGFSTLSEKYGSKCFATLSCNFFWLTMSFWFFMLLENQIFCWPMFFSVITALTAFNRNGSGVNGSPCRYKGVNGVSPESWPLCRKNNGVFSKKFNPGRKPPPPQGIVSPHSKL